MNTLSWLTLLAGSAVAFVASAALSYWQLRLIRPGLLLSAALLSPLLSLPLIVLCMGIADLLVEKRLPGALEASVGGAIAAGVVSALIAHICSYKRSTQANKSLNSDAGKAGAG